MTTEPVLLQDVAEAQSGKAQSAENLPNGWRTTTLGEMGAVSGGGTPSTSIDAYWNGDIPWLVPSDVTSNPELYISRTSRNITSNGLENSSTKLLPPGTVLMTSRATIGEVVINTVEMATNQGFINLILTVRLFLDRVRRIW
ncbi:restriction endonuclease subunit S [Candidatus Chloroploca sp. M-50]|uniref:Restriction endonuclease subunit S n=1 Tax=Candidatus Chloroploca mongolica TaxID=2528176 RepID=A0ABS4D6F5_9CHLR|nr:restriction endonuclease subunit S [Candidatus Chloroploca mongolica]MBP1465023.1 restriction endonuclease subunit S [Candidatus Chloroploca mongolica]